MSLFTCSKYSVVFEDSKNIPATRVMPNMAPWPDQLCPYSDCMRPIRDLLVEMVPNTDRAKPQFKAIMGQVPGGAIACPYCQGAVEYELN